FQTNAKSLMPVPWEIGAELTDDERDAITQSVQIFQLGESSEGRHLSQRSKDWAHRNGDPAYVEAMSLFIKEEQRHAADLGRFLRMHDIPLLQKTFTDTVFRKLRRPVGLEGSICILVTAEIIAKVYYAALREATASRLLRRLCDQILRDEVEHVRFQSQRVAILRRGGSIATIAIRTALQRFLFFGTCLVVWIGHRKTYKRGGFGFRTFWRRSWAELDDAIGQMNPKAYAWPATQPLMPALDTET